MTVLESVEADGIRVTVTARDRAAHVEATVPDRLADELGYDVLEARLALLGTRLLTAYADARRSAVTAGLRSDPRPLSARDRDAADRIAASVVEARSPDGLVTVTLVGGRAVTVVLDDQSADEALDSGADHGPDGALGRAVGRALSAALAEQRVASYRIRCQVFGRKAAPVSRGA
ncbi:hypothetical protein [Nocardioides sp.]|uniref:hypothetical protein n=1 Tax=Nocardioides sp. TaxID=35761 RepID=UPI00271599D4|nr:hypothetical protein [Nocardioides sp.]MDO9456111.1 hypothetical protein [Nocardioides sp.]